MRLSPTDLYTALRPTPCTLRVYLRAKNEPEGAPSPYETVIRELGRRHEESHRASLPNLLDLSRVPADDREQLTLDAIRARASNLYHPTLRTTVNIAGEECVVVGEPDFILVEPGGLVVRDCKMAIRINNDDHPEIFRAMETYGWLLHSVCGEKPIRLEVVNGRGEVIQIPYDEGVAALALMEQIARTRNMAAPPYEPVGWSRCGDCGFNARCWNAAMQAGDVAIVPGVDQGIARRLRELGVSTISELLTTLDRDSLADVKRARGVKMVRIGSAATRIMESAEAISLGKERWLQRPQLPVASNYVMFDCEGLPPQLDEVDKVYLWGFQVFGNSPGTYVGSLASSGVDGDRSGWMSFLLAASNVFSLHGDIPFVHWAVYERVKLDGYVARFGDPDGVAARVRRNLLDLFPITRDCVVLPLPSYSLKVIERHVGFTRSIAEGSGDWAIAKYVEAVETDREDVRQSLLAEISAYNREDLEATWAVLQWLAKER